MVEMRSFPASDHLFIPLLIHTFNHHIFTSTIYETKMHKTCILPSRTPNFEGNQIIGYQALFYCSFFFCINAFQIPNYLVTDFKLLVRGGSLLSACFFSFALHANCWI